MTRQTARLSTRGLERMATSLRSFLGFALLEGLIDAPRANAVPSAARWSVAGLPRSLTPVQVKVLLASCDQGTATGRQDYEILVLLVRLGLRAAEVATLRLDDIDWRGGEIVVRGKGRTEERLPLRAAVAASTSAATPPVDTPSWSHHWRKGGPMLLAKLTSGWPDDPS